MKNSLIIQNLTVKVAEKVVLKDIKLVINLGETHVVMGPNGSGKSSLALTLMGSDVYKIKSGKVILDSQDLFSLKPNERAAIGLFLTFQHPTTIYGVTLGQLLFSSYRSMMGSEKIDIKKFYAGIKRHAKLLGLNEEILERDTNDGFSGGEMKKAEMLTVLSLKPKFVIFDEIDSGLDVDALKKIAVMIKELIKKHTGVILITHNQKILKYVKPDFVHILKEGRIVKTGDYRLALNIEQKGYAKI